MQLPAFQRHSRSWQVFSSACPSHQLIRHPLNLRHIVVPNEIRVIVVPTNSDFAPSRSGHRTKIGRALFPTNAVADFESSGLLAGHDFNLRPWTCSARCISL